MEEGRKNRPGRVPSVGAAEVARWQAARDDRDLSYSQVAREFGVPRDTVRYHLARKHKRATSEEGDR